MAVDRVAVPAFPPRVRRLLWVLLHLGHAVSCLMHRQMERDADVCACQVAGSDTVRAGLGNAPA